MPWIIADEKGRVCHARKKVYNTERGAKMGFKAALDTYLQMHYLYDDDLDYGYYLKRVMNPDDFLTKLITGDPVGDPGYNSKRWDEIIEQFESMYDIKEVTMDLKEA